MVQLFMAALAAFAGAVGCIAASALCPFPVLRLVFAACGVAYGALLAAAVFFLHEESGRP